MPSAEIRPLPLGELDNDDIAAFFSIGFTNHREIIRVCKELDERLYYIRACAKAPWTVEQLQQHLRADDYHHIGALPNNFGKTLSPKTTKTTETANACGFSLSGLRGLSGLSTPSQGLSTPSIGLSSSAGHPAGRSAKGGNANG